VVAVVAAVGVAPGLLSGGPHESGAGAASLPDHIASYSYLTDSVTSDPPGRAIAIYQQGVGVELFDYPQALVLGADGDVYRRVDVAERRSAPMDQGDPAPMALSPDGTRVAIGSNGRAGDLVLLNLVNGGVTTVPARRNSSVVPLAWSPDGRSVVSIESAYDTNPYSASPISGPLVRIDVESEVVYRYPGLTRATAAAYTPDGRELAVQNGDALLVADPGTGAPLRVLSERGLRLTSAGAWSPDGSLLLVGPDPFNEVGLLDAAGHDRTIGTGIVTAYPPVGWTGATTFLVRTTTSEISEVNVDTGVHLAVTTMDPGLVTHYDVPRFQMATGLLAGLRVRPAGRPDRGVWPAWALLTATVLAGVPAVLLSYLLVRRRRRRRLRTAG
jgi:WD40 repeat protein